jgi:DNA-binding NtrC family response regulator
VGGQALTPGSRWPVEAGETLQVGGVRLVYVAWRQVALRPLRTHEYLEQRVAEECIRARRRSATFSLAHVRVWGAQPGGEVDNVLASAIRLTDVLALSAPGLYALLLFDTDKEGAELVVGRLRRVLQQLGARATVAAVHFPGDGQTVDDLVSAARGAVGLSAPSADIEDSRVDVAVIGSDDLIDRVSKSELNVLILGETGSGKEVLAARVHQLSRRTGRPFLKLNCAAFTETLLESELFGHEKGAFTGAHATKLGLLETADSGTVFLDEIGELPLTMQSKLLRVLEERMVLRVGGLKARAIDVRFVAATNRDLAREVDAGRFRADLYFRLDGATLVVPPLRERLHEFDDIARELLREGAARMGRTSAPALTENALTVLKQYQWPGNIRELRNVLERAVMLCEGNEIHRRHLPIEKLTGRFALVRPAADGPPRASSRPHTYPTPLPSVAPPAPATERHAAESPDGRRRRGLGLLASSAARAEIEARERQLIEETLKACAGNQTRAAEQLGVSRRTLIKRIAEYGIARPRSPRLR